MSQTQAKTFTKRLGILCKRDDMTHEQFVAHWMGTHAALCKKLPGLRRYSVNLVDRERFAAFGYDGFSELWFDTEAVYATGINPDGPEHFALARQAEGHRAFKLKIGFGEAQDLRNVRALREALGREAELMVDANQALDLAGAMRVASLLAPFGLRWLEEPLRVDRPAAEWACLAEASGTALAGGENLRGADLLAAAEGGVLRVIQPDITKWGGITGNAPVAAAAVRRGKSFCPHVFGGGVALLASLHLLAAAGGDGTLEFDCHPNAARELVVGALLPVRDGRVPVPDGPGLGATPDLEALSRYRTWPA